MPKIAKEMSAMAVSRLAEPGLYFVGGVKGLALRVYREGGRCWVLRLTIAGHRRDMGMGGFPTVTLAQAREAARQIHAQVRDGINPLAQRQEAQSALRASMACALTFRECAKAYIKAHSTTWRNAKHQQQWANTLEKYAYPKIGDILVKDIAKEHVLAVLEPIWTTKTETATRIRSRMELVLSYAMQANYRPESLNPARWRGGLDKLLPAPNKVTKVDHHAALSVSEAPSFMARLRAANGFGARALEFVVLTAARSGEVRGATWDEIDIQQKIWVIPGERMKAGREHRVPLSAPALAILHAMQAFATGQAQDLVFKSTRGGPLSDMTLTAVMRRMKVPAVPHGFRSTFRDWACWRRPKIDPLRAIVPTQI